jgi:hypothetical protein
MSKAFEKGATTGTKTYNEETSMPEHASSAVRIGPFSFLLFFAHPEPSP